MTPEVYEDEDAPKCPYCGHEQIEDLWEVSDEMSCCECGRDFAVETHTVTTYTTRPIRCNQGAHTFGPPELHMSYDDRLCARWNAERFLGRRDHRPKDVWRHSCTKCLASENRSTTLGGPNPFPPTPERA